MQASRADVQNTALNPAQQNLLTVRQTNAGTNSVTGGDGITSGDLQRAQEVKNFRETNCANLSTQQCDAKVSDAIGGGQLSSVAMVGAALGLGVAIEGATTAGAALAGAIRACAADPVLCGNTAGIVAADALTLGATGNGCSIQVNAGSNQGKSIGSEVRYDNTLVTATDTGAVGHRGRGWGFNVNVAGRTDLKGGVISSTQAAIDAGKNRFQTASLTSSD